MRLRRVLPLVLVLCCLLAGCGWEEYYEEMAARHRRTAVGFFNLEGRNVWVPITAYSEQKGLAFCGEGLARDPSVYEFFPKEKKALRYESLSAFDAGEAAETLSCRVSENDCCYINGSSWQITNRVGTGKNFLVILCVVGGRPGPRGYVPLALLDRSRTEEDAENAAEAERDWQIDQEEESLQEGSVKGTLYYFRGE